MRLKKTLVGVGAALLLAIPIAAQRGAEAAPPTPPAATSAAKAGAPTKNVAAPPPTTAASGAPSAGPATAASAAPAAPSPGGTAPVASVAGKAGPAGAPAMDGPTYAVRLRDLEQRIDELKEQIRRSHTRLSLLSDTILSGGGAGSRAAIRFQNELSSAFRVTRVLVVLDGAVQYNKTDDTGALGEQSTIPIFSGSIPPGDHTVQVLLQFQGNGYGVFSYLRGYKFEVRSTQSFTASEGKTTNMPIIAYEKGGVTTPLEERPSVRYNVKEASGIQGGSGTPAPANSGTPATGSVSVGTGGK